MTCRALTEVGGAEAHLLPRQHTSFLSLNFVRNNITETSSYSFGNSVNDYYITVLCPFNLLIRFKCYNIV